VVLIIGLGLGMEGEETGGAAVGDDLVELGGDIAGAADGAAAGALSEFAEGGLDGVGVRIHAGGVAARFH
jgi:hypothetical protein